ncbi:MAG: RluA family pseudouridine synthase [Proteobacteria bacterium]|nr:RluA family pseudouridine synthase [Pseudomonadota bacterium]
MESRVPARGGFSSHSNSFKIAIDAGLAGIRLDQFLSLTIPSISRSALANSIRKGHIYVDAVCRKSSYRLKEGEIVSGNIEKQEVIDVKPQPIDLTIIYEDEFLLLLSKPPGLVVHPGSGNSHGTLVNGLVHYCQSIAEVGDSLRPGIVHRLDKDTSGIMLVAKQDFVHRKLVDDFKNRRLTKEYLALLHGVLREKSGRLVASVGRHPVHRQKMAVIDNGGRHAVSNWQVLQEFSNTFTLVKIIIETGRTHQIRVHMAHIGCPVVGDRVYGAHRDNSAFPRQLLHASRLVFHHPITDQPMDHVADLWPDFAGIVRELSGEQSGRDDCQ